MSTLGTLTLQQGLGQLAEIVGQQHARAQEEKIVVVPGDAEQIAEVLRFAHRNGLIVMPTGGCSKLDWGNPISCDIELSTRRLGAVREHAWQDMTCTVGAGCAWADLQRELSDHGQMVALDPLWPERASVGGIVASNDSGALRLKYGGLRDLIIGMTIVLADGTIAKSGGKVVKNVAGYDIHKLMTGSFGTLGIIAEVNFRLHPLEEHRRTWTASPRGSAEGDADVLAEPLRALMDSHISPSSVQLRVEKQGCALDVRIAGPVECLDEYDGQIRKLFGQFAIRESEEEIWLARQGLFASEAGVVLKLSVLPDAITSISAELLRRTKTDSLEVAVVAQANGLMTVHIDGADEAVVAMVDKLRARARASGGSVAALRVSNRLRGQIDVWGPDGGTLPLMREIKKRFDAAGTLNPGRFIGNI